MQIGVPKEVKDHEDRVGLVPSSVAELVHHGHQVIVEKGAGIGSGLSDAEYTPPARHSTTARKRSFHGLT
jgi:alanine dehydrogenase